MSSLQKTFLLYVFIYFLCKGALYCSLYVICVMIEKNARMRWAKLRVILKAKREDEERRWSTAYRLYYQREAERKAAAADTLLHGQSCDKLEHPESGVAAAGNSNLDIVLTGQSVTI
jgi:hypothetical protein